jgi:hypothetical protein
MKGKNTMNSIIVKLDDVADVNKAFERIRKQYPKAKVAKAVVDFEALEDERLLALAMERERNNTGVRVSWEEHLAKRGLTPEDIKRMLEEEDVELEYELPVKTIS